MKPNLAHSLLLAGMLAAPAIAKAAGPAPGDRLYVTIAYDDPVSFERYRYGFDDGKDIVLGTLGDRAQSDAQAAHWPTPIVVLDEKTPPPPNQPVLRLSWNSQQEVLAEYLPDKDARPYYLGVVSRSALAFGPDPTGAVNRIKSASNDLARRDQEVKERVAEYLYIALGYTEKHLKMPRG